MLKAIFSTLRFIILVLAGHKEIALENAALRQQLTILKREQPRPKLRHLDRLFWIAMMKIWKQWRTALVVVQPATVVSWAAVAIQAVLEEAVSEEETRTAADLCQSPEAGSNNGGGERHVGRAPNSR